MKPQEALMRVIDHHEIHHDEMLSLMHQIIEGEISPELISAIIIGLRVKRETIGEIVAASQVIRNLVTKVDLTNPRNTGRYLWYWWRYCTYLQYFHCC